MSDSLRIVITVENSPTHTSIRSVDLSARQIELIRPTTDTSNLAQWAAEQIGSIISCLEDMSNG
jgi:hypothetical protein